MNVFTKLTLRNLKLNKKRTIGTIIGIMLSTALICAVAGMATSLHKTLIETTIADTGYYHLKLSKVTETDIEKFQNNRDVKDVNVINDVGYSILPDSQNSNKPYIHLYSLNETTFNNMSLKLIEGRYPQNNNEIAISEDVINDAKVDYKIGDKITLNIGDRYAGEDYIKSGFEYEPYEAMYNPDGTKKDAGEEIKVNLTQEFTIVGIMSKEDTPIKAISYMYDAGYTCVTNGLNMGNTNMYIALKNPSDCESAFMEMIGLDMDSGEFANTDYIYSINYELLRWEAFEVSDSTMTMITAIVIVAIIIIILTSIYCIKNAFAISLIEKIKMYGMLSSVGATKRQIRKSVIQEGMILSLIGIPLGILAGVAAVFILVIIVREILGDILNAKIVFSMSIIPILLSAILGLVTVYFSCLSAARKAKKITPLEAIRSSQEIKINSKKIKAPKFIKKLFGVGGVIAYKNLKRSKKKYRTTVISIAVSVFVFIASSALISYAFEAMSGYYKNYDYNFSITCASTTGNELLKVIQNEKLSNYTLVYDIRTTDENSSPTMVVEDTSKISNFGNKVLNEYNTQLGQISIEVIGLNSKDFETYCNKVGLNYENIKNQAILYDYCSLYADGKTTVDRLFTYSKNDIITGTIQNKVFNIKIGGVTDIVPNGFENISSRGIIILNTDEYKDEIHFRPYILAIDSDTPDELEQQIQKYDDVYIFNIANEVKFYDAMNLVISIFAYGFIAVITLVGVTNIFNTLTSNIELRQREFAMLKSIGMTKKEFNRMINLETIFYSVKALLYGIVLGIIASYAVYRAFSESLDYGFKIPFTAILISIIFVFVMVFIIMRFAISKINKQNVVETIRKENI